jgi:hypothetical protein
MMAAESSGAYTARLVYPSAVAIFKGGEAGGPTSRQAEAVTGSGATPRSRRSTSEKEPTSWRRRTRNSRRAKSSLPRDHSRTPSFLQQSLATSMNRSSRSTAPTIETRRNCPEGGHVLVVGGGHSGFQMAEELAATGTVDLAVGKRVPALPQRLLGRDLFWWLSGIGFMNVSTDSRLGRKLAKRDVLIGSSPRRLRRSGVTLRTRLTSAKGRRAVFEDGSELDVDAIVWATGYRSDCTWIDIPTIKDERGGIIHRRGVTDVPGVLFIGLTWQHTRGPALIGFAHDDAAFIAGRIESRLENRAGLTIRTESERT